MNQPSAPCHFPEIVVIAFAALLATLGCSSKDSAEDGKGHSSNINKVVIGGDNSAPQMGIFALTPADASRVDKTNPAKARYELAMKLAKKTWAGDRGFCEDAVRMTIRFLGTDGMLKPEARERWAKATFEEVEREHIDAINTLHKQMINESNPELCRRTLRQYVEALVFISQNDLDVRNFGF